MRTVTRIAAVVAGIVVTAGARADADGREYGFIEGFVVHHEERIPERERSFGGRIGLGFVTAETPRVRTAVEIGIFTNPIKREGAPDERQSGLMIDLSNTWNLGMVDPYVFAGLGGVQEFSDVAWAAEAGVGTLVNLGRDVDLRVAVSGQSVWDGQVRADKDQYMDYRAIVGFATAFGGVAAPAPAAAPPPPADGDGDGVPDAQDRCPAQPAPTADGCPIPFVPAAPPRDTDGDGIDDSKDECPGTLEGLQVDASGCVAAASAQKVVLKGVNFLPNSTELTPDAKRVLDEAYDALAGQTNLNVEVGGHTDSMGDEKLNESLSQRRAESVKKYLTGKGIDAGRLTARGYGEGQPVADNKTKAGRQENRRVELKILN